VHTDGLYRYAVRLCGDPEVASDLVQDALTRGFDAFGRLRADTNHRAWIFTILRNTYISRVRRAGREELLEEPATVIDIRRSHDPIAALVRREDGYRHGFEDPVLDALASLPEGQRTAVVLCDIEGLRYEEIAEVLDCPVGTVRSRIHHARKRLRAALGGYAHKRGYGRSDDVAL
jgi:RNA polymerase sigma-70 factor, ECF subfamily